MGIKRQIDGEIVCIWDFSREIMYQLLKPLLFKMDAEFVHEKGIKAIPWLTQWMGDKYIVNDSRFTVEMDDLKFPNPIGLGAGFDKSAHVFPNLHHFGFGFVEVGTLTPLPQAGNPKPRLFRIPSENSLLNRMGFNNEGALAAAGRLKHLKRKIPVGVNIGKNKDTPNEDAVSDYVRAYEALAEYGDYLVVNVSSPNTKNLRALQDKDALSDIFSALNEKNQNLKRPIFLKVAPDLTESALEDIVAIVEEVNIYGIIATNTTIDHSGLPEKMKDESGGVSGNLVKKKSDKVLKFLAQRLFGKCKFIGVGGVETTEDVIRKIEYGADLVQIYSAWIYQGPSFVYELLNGLRAELDKRGCRLSELKGSALNT